MAFRTVLRQHPISRAMARMRLFSMKYALLISSRFSTLIISFSTFHELRNVLMLAELLLRWVHFRLSKSLMVGVF
jgi:hypothetical protein